LAAVNEGKQITPIPLSRQRYHRIENIMYRVPSKAAYTKR